MKWFIAIAVLLFALMTATFVVAQSTGRTEGVYVVQKLSELQDITGSRVVVGCMIALFLALDLVLPVPSSVVMTVSGGMLGMVTGAAVAFAGSMVSALIGFGLCRLFGRRAFARLVGEKDTSRIEEFFETYGAWAIILSRSVPMLTEVISCLAGLSPMSARRFTLLTVAGTLPVCLVYAWVGATAGSARTGIAWALLVAFIIPALGLGLVQIMQHARRDREPGAGAPGR